VKRLAILLLVPLVLGAGWPQPKRISVADCTPARYAPFVDQAIIDWNAFRVTKMRLVVCGEPSDVEVRYVTGQQHPSIADANLTYDSRWNLQRAVIRLNGDILDLPTITPRYLRYVVSHEFGHAQGLPHNTLAGSVMSVVDGNVWVPTAVDGGLLKALYGGKGR